MVYGFVGVAMAAGQLGLRKEAEAALTAILAIDPDYGDHAAEDLAARTLHPDLVRIGVDGLRKAGLSSSTAVPAMDQDLH